MIYPLCNAYSPDDSWTMYLLSAFAVLVHINLLSTVDVLQSVIVLE